MSFEYIDTFICNFIYYGMQNQNILDNKITLIDIKILTEKQFDWFFRFHAIASKYGNQSNLSRILPKR